MYDTAGDRQLWRAKVTWPAAPPTFREHVRRNGFFHVSASEVVWRPASAAPPALMYRFDMASGTTSRVETDQPGKTALPEDVHDATRVCRVDEPLPQLLIESADGGEVRPEGMEPFARLSPDGASVLSPTSHPHGAAIIDVASGETWLLPLPTAYAWISWSYGDLAMVALDLDVDGSDSALLTCEANTRVCEELPSQGGVLMPTS